MTNNDGGRGGRGRAGRFHLPYHPKKQGIDSKEAVPALIYGPSNIWVEFSKRIAIYVGVKYAVLNSIMKQSENHGFPVPREDFSIADVSTRQSAYLEAFKLRL